MSPTRWLAKQIKHRREAQGLLQKDLAKLMNVSPTTIHRYEHAQTEPPVFIAMKICAYLGIDLSDAPELKGPSTRNQGYQQQESKREASGKKETGDLPYGIIA